jgi:predicted metal-binding membrane protein
VIAAAIQAMLTRLAVLDAGMATASPLFAGAIFVGAGLYQFSALKTACVTMCQRPVILFENQWSAAPLAAFRLGLAQGRACVGCCAVMMLLMFAVGAMNVVWMAGLGAVMAAEKIAETTKFSRLIGVVFAVIGVAILIIAVTAQWPAGPHHGHP